MLRARCGGEDRNLENGYWRRAPSRQGTGEGRLFTKQLIRRKVDELLGYFAVS